MDFVDSLKNIKEEMIKEASLQKEEENEAKEQRLRNEFFELVKDSNIKRK